MRVLYLPFCLGIIILVAGCGAVPVDGSISESDGNALGTGDITGFELLDATAGRSLGPLGATVVLSDFSTTQFSIRAIVSSASTGSLSFTLDGPDADNYEHTEKWAPYTLGGDGVDANGNKTYVGRSLAVGTYTLTAAFSDASKTVTFDVVARASAFRVVDTETGARTKITPDQKFSVAQWPSAFSIEAAVTSSTGVVISLLADSNADGTYETTLRSKLESSAPWVLCGNSGSQVFTCPMALGVGNYKARAMASTGSYEVAFSIVNEVATTPTPAPTQTATPSPTATPAPGQNGLLPDDVPGYVSRPCGFDMDDDGIPGEPEDCNVCDGMTQDPDGDGINEDLIYVDCNSGSDLTGDGSPARPFLTIDRGFGRADGPGDGAEDILCARATCSPAKGSGINAQDIPWSGVATGGENNSWYYTRPRRGPEERDFRYPANPVMVVGWDTDNDGQYPPYDTDQSEPLVFDACSDANCSGTKTALGFNPRTASSYIELAHFTMKNYGRGTSDPAGAITFANRRSGDRQGHYYHDIILEGISQGEEGVSSRAAIYLMATRIYHQAFENIKVMHFGGWPVRGGVSKSEYLRFRNFEQFGPRPAAGSNVLPFKLWGVYHLEVLNFKFDADYANMGVTPSGIQSIIQSGSSEDVVYRNGEHTDCNGCIHVSFRGCNDLTGPGTERHCMDADNQWTLRDVVIDRQHFHHKTRFASSHPYVTFVSVSASSADGKAAEGTAPAGDTRWGGWGTGGANNNFGAYHTADPACVGIGLANVTISNSVFQNDATGLMTGIEFKVGSNCSTAPLNDPLIVRNNTFRSSTPFNAAWIRTGRHWSQKYDHDYLYYANNYQIDNNVFAGTEATKAIELKHIGYDGYYGTTKYPSDFVARSNAFDREMGFVRDTVTKTTLSDWQQATGYEVGSDRCSTAFRSDGFHLADGDTCSKDRGLNIACSANDVDGDPRLRTTGDRCDRGADEWIR